MEEEIILENNSRTMFLLIRLGAFVMLIIGWYFVFSLNLQYSLIEYFLYALVIAASYQFDLKLPLYFGKEEIKVNLGKDYLILTWLDRIQNGTYVKQYIKFDQIQTYCFESTMYFDFFRLKVDNLKMIKISEYSGEKTIDFSHFSIKFRSAVSKYNKLKRNEHRIEIEKSILDKKGVQVFVAIFISIIILSSLILLLTRGVQNWDKIYLLLIFIGPFIWSIKSIVMRIKNKSASKK